MPFGYQIWYRKYPWPKCNVLLGAKSNAVVSYGQPEVKMLRNTLWPPNLVGRIPDQSIMLCWDQRSCRGQPGSTRGQIARKSPMATKFGNKNPWPQCNTLEVKGHPVVIWGQQEGNCLEMPAATKCGQCCFRAYAATGALVYNNIYGFWAALDMV